jgi:Asp/Glu/hydantoin racemase
MGDSTVVFCAAQVTIAALRALVSSTALVIGVCWAFMNSTAGFTRRACCRATP